MRGREDRLKSYQKFNEIITSRGITPYRVATDLGFSPMALSDWKAGRSEPKMDKLLAIANYLDIDVSVFLVDTEKAVV